MNFFLMLISLIITAILSLVGGYFLILGKSKLVKTIQKFGPVIAFVVLVYAVFGDLIPEILEEEELELKTVIILVSAGFIVCAIIGKVLGKFHHHNDIHHHDHKKHEIETHGDKELKDKAQAYTMLAVDSIHAVADGIVLGTSFLTSFSTGISACLATIAHEIPQEIGDFSIMQRAKMKAKDIIKLQTLSGLIIVPAAAVAYFVGDSLVEMLPGVLAVVAGFLLYVAFGELICVIESLKK